MAPAEEDPISTPFGLVAILLLVLANGFFVATEFALVSVRRTRVQHLASEGSARARSVLGLLDHLDLYIAATQLGITMSSIALGFIGEPALARLIEPLVHDAPFIPETWRENATHTVAFIFAYTVVTILHIVFGELAPKSIALQRSEETSLWVAAPIRWFTIILKPAIYGLNTIGNAVVRLFGISPAGGHALVQSTEELKLSIDASREAGLVEQAAQDLVERALIFTDLHVRHAMVPRTELAAISVDASLHEVLRVAAENSHTRLPVYEKDSDHIVGIINIKRLLPLIYEVSGGDRPEGFDVRDHMTEPLALPESVAAVDVLTRMRETRVQMAVIIDEYGGTAGIVTLEDLVENLVGEIRDEGENVEPDNLLEPDGSRILDGLTTLFEAKEYFDLDLDETLYDVETVGGWVFGMLGRPAEIGDEVVVPDGWTLRVDELDGLRVARVRVLPVSYRDDDRVQDASAAGSAVDSADAAPTPANERRGEQRPHTDTGTQDQRLTG